MKLEKRGSDRFIVSTKRPHDWPGDKVVTAPSTDEAWKQVLPECPGLERKDCFFGRDMGYVMVAIWADGTSKEHPIQVFESVKE